MQTFILIGGIASGKSEALATFRELGIKCFSADEIARECIEKDTEAYQAIIQKCGQGILDDKGYINRAKLRILMLENANFKHWLESLLHPEIRKRLIEKAASAPSPYCVLEIPLLKNKADYPHSKVLYIHTDTKRQKMFLKLRGLSQSEIDGLLAIQIPEAISQKIADIIIENDDSINALKAKIMAFHNNVVKQKKP